MPDQERGIPADLQRIAHAIAGESDDHCWADVFNAALQALLAERERAARITIEKGGEWLELAQAIAAAIRDHSGREK